MYEQYPYYYPYYYYPPTSPAYYPAYAHAQRQQQMNQAEQNEGMLPMEESYIENILRLNKGKEATVYMTIDNHTKTFRGVIEAAGRDHIILSDPETGERYLLLMVYLDYVVFDEKINYQYPLANESGQLTNYPPR